MSVSEGLLIYICGVVTGLCGSLIVEVVRHLLTLRREKIVRGWEKEDKEEEERQARKRLYLLGSPEEIKKWSEWEYRPSPKGPHGPQFWGGPLLGLLMGYLLVLTLVALFGEIVILTVFGVVALCAFGILCGYSASRNVSSRVRQLW
jgi:hypothetical protein